jgi:hypothetical protein
MVSTVSASSIYRILSYGRNQLFLTRALTLALRNPLTLPILNRIRCGHCKKLEPGMFIPAVVWFITLAKKWRIGDLFIHRVIIMLSFF